VTLRRRPWQAARDLPFGDTVIKPLRGGERPDLVAIASSDSDFAPLVLRLREKGCRVVGIGQAGKTGDETQTVYDAFTVLAHRAAAAPAPAPAPAPARKVASRSRAAAASPSAPRKTPARRKAPAKAVAETTTTAPTPTPTAEPVADTARRILMALPELVRGDTVELRVAAERLKAAGLLSRSGASTKVFGAFPEPPIGSGSRLDRRLNPGLAP
jgi:hypothetical protein